MAETDAAHLDHKPVLSFHTIAWIIRSIQRAKARRLQRARLRGGSYDPVAESVRAPSVHPDSFLDPYRLFWGFRLKPEWVLKPWSKRLLIWLGVVSVAVMYNLLMIFPRAAFEYHENEHGLWTSCTIVDYLADAIYLLDMLISVATGYLEEGIVVREPRKIWRRYRATRRFKLDLLSIFPTDFLFLYTKQHVPSVIVRMNRLLKLPRLSEFIYRAESRSDNPLLLRISVSIGLLIVIIHINGCLYYFISAQIGIGEDRWVYPAVSAWRTYNNSSVVEPRLHLNDSMYEKWVFSFYWSAVVLTSILPNAANPATTWEFVFHCSDIIFGMLVFATIVARISAMILNISKKRDVFKEKEEGVKSYMHAHKEIGSTIQTKVLKWFDYIWRTKQDLDEDSVLTLLPEKLKIEIARHVHLDVLKRVKIFQDVDEQFLDELVVKLKFQPFSPGDYICRKGEIGRQMYVVRRGKLDVVSDDGMKVFVTLGAGTVFGELSILNIAGSKHGNRRTANVRAVGYADLFSLSKEDLWECLEEYPAVRASLLDKACQILKRDDLLDESAAVELARRNRDFEKAADDIEGNVLNLEERIELMTKEYEEAMWGLEEEMRAVEREARSLHMWRHKQSFQRTKDTRRSHSAGDQLIEEDGGN